MAVADQPGFKCPVCGSSSAGWTAQHAGLRVARCSACQHGYVWPVPEASFLESIYRDPAYYSGGNDSYGFRDYQSLASARRKMFRRHLASIESSSSVGRILDVGCANGDFLRAARDRGWETFGADPSVARAQVESAGIKLVGTTVHDADVAPGSLDVITFWDVLEHVADPIADLARARELLRAGGVLTLTVPDARNLVARMSGDRWFGYKTAGEHLQFFSRASLRLALLKAGFEVKRVEATRWSCTIGFLADRAGLYMGPPGRMFRTVVGRTGSLTVDLPQINQFALAVAAAPTSREPANAAESRADSP